ncbi:hypothetical protein [Allokutzneria sp. NRRL B-24872]|uniref:hypothetical protein n=1 Tax=Allokutzneria sp. NRRL B-24872 TaxID=1137961 RepID=UPI000A37D24F|nr:hypothetical protein [Allokutzneria sp. NRRL B-24872]
MAEEHFFELAEKCLARARPGTELRKRTLSRIRGNGQLSSFDLGVEFTANRIELVDERVSFSVQFSVLRIGGKLDTPPYCSLNRGANEPR